VPYLEAHNSKTKEFPDQCLDTMDWANNGLQKIRRPKVSTTSGTPGILKNLRSKNCEKK